MTSGGIHKSINVQLGKAILGTRFVQVSEIYVNSPLVVLLLDDHYVG